MNLLQRILGDVSDFFNPYHDPGTGRFTSTAAGGQVGTVFSKGGHRGVVASTTPFGPEAKPAGWKDPADEDDDMSTESRDGGIVVEYSKSAKAIGEKLESNYDELQAFRRKASIPAPRISSTSIRRFGSVKQEGITLSLGTQLEAQYMGESGVQRQIVQAKTARQVLISKGRTPRENTIKVRRVYPTAITVSVVGSSPETKAHLDALVKRAEELGMAYSLGELRMK